MSDIKEVVQPLVDETETDLNKLKLEVEQLLKYTYGTHKYSMSRIYGLYNKVFGKDEKPQSCASCLIRKTKELEQWLNNQEKEAAQTKIDSTDMSREVGNYEESLTKKKYKKKGK